MRQEHFSLAAGTDDSTTRDHLSNIQNETMAWQTISKWQGSLNYVAQDFPTNLKATHNTDHKTYVFS